MNWLSHLSDADLVDLVDDAAGPAARDHVASCPSCAARLESLQQAWSLAASDPAEDPSPLFWGHLSSRIGDAVRTETPIGQGSRWGWVLVAAPALAVAIAFAIVLRPGPSPVSPSPLAPAIPEAAAATGDAAAALAWADDDESWQLVTMLSEGLGADETGSPMFEPRLGAADRAVSQLSADEQEALVRLLAEELGNGPS